MQCGVTDATGPTRVQAATSHHDWALRRLLQHVCLSQQPHRSGCAASIGRTKGDRSTWGRNTPLIAASSLGRSSAVRLLLEYGARVDEPAADGLTPLHAAAMHCHVEALQTLLSFGADPRAALRGKAATFLNRQAALQSGDRLWDAVAIASLLHPPQRHGHIRRMPDGSTVHMVPPGKDCVGIMRAAAAARKDDDDDEAAEAAEEAAAAVDRGRVFPNVRGSDDDRVGIGAARQTMGDVLLDIARRGPMHAQHESDLRYAKQMLEAAPHLAHHVDARTGALALHGAAVSADMLLVTALLDAGSPVDPLDGNGATPLMLAASTPHERSAAVVTTLLARGASVRTCQSRAHSLPCCQRLPHPADCLS